MESLAEQFRRASSDPNLVVLEGFHALKHAFRFGAQLETVVASGSFADLAASLAPDLAPLAARATRVDSIEALSPRAIPTGVAAIARRPAATLPREGTVVLLENPRHLGNAGAVVRVAAAASAAAVLTTGSLDPWHPECIRGAAGLHFAVHVARASLPLDDARLLIAFDPTGAPLKEALPTDAILAFGTEREGLTVAVLDRAHHVARIPMRKGVSSLNLATAVAVALYARAPD